MSNPHVPPQAGGRVSSVPGGIGAHDPAADILFRLAHTSRDFSRYSIGEQVGRGGMGVVLSVHDPDLHRTLAMKRLRPLEKRDGVLEGSPEGVRRVARFLEEAQVTGQLDHPGIVPVHELGLDPDGQPYFTMKLVRGNTLERVIELARAGQEGWTVTRVIGVLVRVCEAMSYAHSHHVVHRDLKPSNIMLGRFGEAYVMDWGLARVTTDDERDGTQLYSPRHSSSGSSSGSPLATEAGAVLGTPSYMSPEQARGGSDDIGPQTDVYAVGAILYHLLSGHSPYELPGTPRRNREIWLRLQQGPPPRLDAVAKESPPELVAIVEKAMQRDPAQRYARMEDLGDDLRAYLENRVVGAYRTGPIVELKKWVARNRGAAAALAVLAAFLIATGFVYGATQRARSRGLELQTDSLLAGALVTAADSLWPNKDSARTKIEDWIVQARALVARRSAAEAELASMRADLVSRGRAEVRGEVEPRVITEASVAANWAATWNKALADVRTTTAPADASAQVLEQRASSLEVLPGEVEYWTGRSKRFQQQIARSQVTYCPDPHDRQQIDALERLALGARTLSDWTLPQMQARGELARLAEDARSDPAWPAAITEIEDAARCPLYGGKVHIRPQFGLVPLRRDPRSGLFEFWHVLSGNRPLDDGAGGWKVDADTGLVLILVPGGETSAGAQSKDPNAARYDPAAGKTEALRVARLDPYFLSKYEMTQGQWRRMTGELPSAYFVGMSLFTDPRVTAAHPVENVTWWQATEVLNQFSLELPTEIQWENAARAGSDRRYSTSDDPSAVRALANACDDRYARAAHDQEPGYDDGHALPASVGSFAPNGFGFHDVLGNVSEWCLDWYADSCATVLPSPGTGEIRPSECFARSYRGGSYQRAPTWMRVSRRANLAPDSRADDLGVRPARRADSN